MRQPRRAARRARGRGARRGRGADADRGGEGPRAMSERLGAGFDHGAMDPHVDSAVIRGQLATAAALRRRLDERGGAILGDEVGAGKTFVSFALITDLLLRDPGQGVVVFVPTRLLVSKWSRQLRDYLIASIPD